MKKILLILVACHLSLIAATAQPDWVKKASKSVFTLKTFAHDGSLIASSNGFFVGAQGEAVSNFSPFKGAARAIVIDAAGKEMNVTAMMGANETYDVAKFRVAGKTLPLTVCQSVVPTGALAWLLPYHDTKNVLSGTIRKAEKFQADYAYYTIAMKMPEQAVSCPLLNDAGEVVGLMQPSASAADTLSYAVSARFADSLKVNGLSLNDPALKQTSIKMELPDNLTDANLILYMAGSTVDSATYVSLVDDFISKFPSAPEGYLYRANTKAAAGEFDAADSDMQLAVKTAEPKDFAHYNYARIIYNKWVYNNAKAYDPWTLDKAREEARQAYAINPLPAYRQMEADILYAQQQYSQAHDLYVELARADGNADKAELWFYAARCKEMLKDTTTMLALLDSTMNCFTRPYLKEAATYLWYRANARMDAGKYREAVSDMNDYEQLMAAQVNAQFYYIRHQAEIEGRLYQQALNDISRAVTMEPDKTLYYAEKASLEIRVGHYDEALATARECIAVDPDGSDGYLFLGLAQCLEGNKAEGIANLQKAKDLGDPQAEGLIQKYK